MTNFQPWSTRLTFTNINPRTSATGVPLGASLSNPYNAFVGGPPFPYNGSYATGGGIFGVSQDFEWSHAYQTNVGVQRQIGRSAGRRRGLRRDVQPRTSRSVVT